MARTTLCITLTILLAIQLSACSLTDTGTKTPIEMIAFGGLADEEQGYIPVSPKDSTVELVPVDAKIRSIISPGYAHDKVYTVTFHHLMSDDPSRGELVVYVDLDQETVLGRRYIAK